MNAKQMGITVLIEGSPGVGKTALLDELGRTAKKESWHVARIEPAVLWNLKALRFFLRISKEMEIFGI